MVSSPTVVGTFGVCDYVYLKELCVTSCGCCKRSVPYKHIKKRVILTQIAILSDCISLMMYHSTL